LVYSVYGGVVASHKVFDGAVDQSLFCEGVFSFKQTGFNSNSEVASSAIYLDNAARQSVKDTVLELIDG